MRSSQAAFDLIVAEEVSSEETYKRKYRKPEWPGEQSGATIGIGYDLGQTAKSTVIADWKGRVSDEMLDAMVSACGKTGKAGKAATAKVRSKIDIPWDVALEVHQECVVPRWEANVAAALPNTKKLSADCFGALLSLTFNRGPSFSTAGERYREMRAIKAHMEAEEFDAIPSEFRAMKRLWPNSIGLRKRRDTEAKLFEKGLIVNAVEPVVVKPITAPPLTELQETTVQGDADVWNAQRRLKAMGYNPGGLDGIWGGMTAGAISGFINDRKLDIAPPTSAEMFLSGLEPFRIELAKAESDRFTRPIAPERAEATDKQLAPKLPEVQASIVAERVTWWGGILGVFGGITKFMSDAIEWLRPVKEFIGDMPWYVWGLGILTVATALLYSSRKSRQSIDASTQAYNEGSRV